MSDSNSVESMDGLNCATLAEVDTAHANAKTSQQKIATLLTAAFHKRSKDAQIECKSYDVGQDVTKVPPVVPKPPRPLQGCRPTKEQNSADG